MDNEQEGPAVVGQQVREIGRETVKTQEARTESVLYKLKGLEYDVGAVREAQSVLYQNALNTLQRDINRRSWFSVCTGFVDDHPDHPVMTFSWKKTFISAGKVAGAAVVVSGIGYATGKMAERGGRRAASEAVENLLAASSAEDDTTSDDDI